MEKYPNEDFPYLILPRRGTKVDEYDSDLVKRVVVALGLKGTFFLLATIEDCEMAE